MKKFKNIKIGGIQQKIFNLVLFTLILLMTAYTVVIIHQSGTLTGLVGETSKAQKEGYTLQDATGAWTDETGEITHEYTLVCYFDGADKETVYRAADEVIEALNQNTVLIEKDEITTEYYGGR